MVEPLEIASMSSLRAATIKLAHENPTLRKHLLPILKVGESEPEVVLENQKVRVKFWRNEQRLLVQELSTKPVKKSLRRRDYNSYYEKKSFGDELLMINLYEGAKLSSSMDFDDVLRAVDASIVKAKGKILQKQPGLEVFMDRAGFPKSMISDDTVYFLEVEPSDYKPVAFVGTDFSGTSEWTAFRVMRDRDEDEAMAYLESMRTFYEQKSPAGARALFTILKADPDFFKGMSAEQFFAYLNSKKIGYEYVPTVNR